jgi:hypothetical protein
MYALKTRCDGPLSNFAFKFKLRRYGQVASLPNTPSETKAAKAIGGGGGGSGGGGGGSDGSDEYASAPEDDDRGLGLANIARRVIQRVLQPPSLALNVILCCGERYPRVLKPPFLALNVIL